MGCTARGQVSFLAVAPTEVAARPPAKITSAELGITLEHEGWEAAKFDCSHTQIVKLAM